MKKIIIVSAILTITLLAFGAVGFAYAQDPQPPAPEYPFGPGHMGGHRHGMMGFQQAGLMHETMVSALSEALDLTKEEIEERFSAGENLWDIAAAQGLSAEAFGELMTEAHASALEEAVAEGLLSPEQAEWMEEHMQQRWSDGGQYSGFGGHCGGRGRFNNNSRWGAMSY